MIQSLLTQAEYDKCSLKYNTYNVKFRKYTTDWRWVDIGGVKTLCGPPPCYQMGNKLTPLEVTTMNAALEILRTKLDAHRCEDNKYPGPPFIP